MITLLLAAAATTAPTVVEAEQAFAQLAQDQGQWAAFRATAAADAIMFVPEPVKAQAWLKDRRDPTKSVRWWPTQAWQSCDGKVAVTTGGAEWPDGRSGYFTTVWKRQRDGGWKWVLDHGGFRQATAPSVAQVALTTASCSVGQKPILVPRGAWSPGKRSVKQPGDKTLAYSWEVLPDGTRTVSVSLWNGQDYEPVLTDREVAPTP